VSPRYPEPALPWVGADPQQLYLRHLDVLPPSHARERRGRCIITPATRLDQRVKRGCGEKKSRLIRAGFALKYRPHFVGNTAQGEGHAGKVCRQRRYRQRQKALDHSRRQVAQSDGDGALQHGLRRCQDLLRRAWRAGDLDQGLLHATFSGLKPQRSSKYQYRRDAHALSAGARPRDSIKPAARDVAGLDAAWHQPDDDGLAVLDNRRQAVLLEEGRAGSILRGAGPLLQPLRGNRGDFLAVGAT